MLSSLRNELAALDMNLLGKRVSQKIVVFESDDWGATRMTGRDAYTALLENKIRVDKSVYCKFDILESDEDVQMLADVLS
jgi:hypothetical protein